MLDRTGKARASVTLVTAAILVILTLVVPLLDRGEAAATPALAGENAPAGILDHHHGICLQHAAAAWILGTAAPKLVPVPGNEDPLPATWPNHIDSAPRTLHRSRAPPAA